MMSRIALSLVVSLLACMQFVCAQSMVNNTFYVSSPFESNTYNFSGAADGANPILTLNAGVTYIFNLTDVASNHPFWIIEEHNKYFDFGVGNYSTPARYGNILTWTAPLDAPSTLYYECDIHGFYGVIQLQFNAISSTADWSSSSSSSSGAWWLNDTSSSSSGSNIIPIPTDTTSSSSTGGINFLSSSSSLSSPPLPISLDTMYPVGMGSDSNGYFHFALSLWEGQRNPTINITAGSTLIFDLGGITSSNPFWIVEGSSLPSPSATGYQETKWAVLQGTQHYGTGNKLVLKTAINGPKYFSYVTNTYGYGGQIQVVGAIQSGANARACCMSLYVTMIIAAFMCVAFKYTL